MERYRLGPLREARQLDVRAKRNDLAVAVGDARITADELAAAERRITAAREVLAAARAARDALLAAPTSPSLLALADRHIARRRRDLDAAIAEHARARATHAGREAVVDAARVGVTAARADKELIERHFARWREAQRRLADRRED